MQLLVIVIGILILSIFIYFSVVFIKEHEKRASIASIISGLVLAAPFAAIAYLIPENRIFPFLLIFVSLLVCVLLLIPYRKYAYPLKTNFDFRYDERQIMFSRAELSPGSDRYIEYYQNNPAHKQLDNKFRQKPGLMSKQSQKYHLLKFASAEANFEVVHSFIQNIPENIAGISKSDFTKDELTYYIKKWAKNLGIINIGITQLKDYHLYSHKGRGEEYGRSIEKKHTYAIAFTVEMKKNMLDLAPNAETVIESSQQYLNAASIASQITVFIRKLGYSARAHFDGNYDVICPLVARDAGLGEFGRMGLLMTPYIGPRVRIGVVTTDIPLICDTYKTDYSVLDFCTKCKKCADNCPSSAISFKNMGEKNGSYRWSINHEACFTYWTIIGTDCGKCIQVCPYSHPDNLMHNLIRKGIKNSSLFASFALNMDDIFYGRKPNNKAYKSPLD